MTDHELAELMQRARAALDAVVLLEGYESPDVPDDVVQQAIRGVVNAYTVIVNAHPLECEDCGMGLIEDEAVWSECELDPDDNTYPYCVGCLPNEPGHGDPR